MVTSLFEHERIVTTQAKARSVRPFAEKLITLAKRGDLHSRRLALAVITKKSVTHKLFSEIKDRFIDRSGGYTSMVKLEPRRGDAAPMAVLQLIKPQEEAKKQKKTKKKGAAKKKADTKTAAKPAPKTQAQPPEEPPVVKETAPADPVVAQNETPESVEPVDGASETDKEEDKA